MGIYDLAVIALIIAPWWFGGGFIVGCIAMRRGFNGWRFLSYIFSGPLALPYALADQGGRKPCPRCLEPVMPEAEICPHCRSQLL